ncbi:mitochondrial 54S ribosomal protein YmL35 [Coemansia erecta]|uniref:Mitochondrial 54S ribosomal protein YmL35 n=1 Tax=Coemansia erecta TaxID=147472 RepID=A0A9W8CVP3_9FUNG|nr:mitochondrial 54S ribosomal protein YmL35 [Coemansia erecta]
MSVVTRVLNLGKRTCRTQVPRILGRRLESTYVRPATGVNSTYDEALKVIDEYKAQITAEADAAARELKQAQDSGASDENVSELKKRWFDLAVESEIRDSEVLWNAKMGKFDLSRPVYQHLKQKAWLARPLEVLMQRLLQMFVLPDLMDPRIVGIPESQLKITMSGAQEAIEPGVVIDPKEAREQLGIELVTFREESRLHTLVMVDLDEPFEEQQTFREQFHWVAANLPFSMTKTTADFAEGDVLLPYIPPHPAKGTPTHRYAVVAFEQGDAGQTRISGVEASRDMVLHEFATKHSLRPVGISFFRATWNESVDEVYRDILNLPPPSFGSMPKPHKNIGPDGRKISAYENY